MQTSEGCSSLAQVKPVVIGVVGGPGSGKGTQCEMLCQGFRVSHISVGDVLRAEAADQDSPYRETIRKNMLAGTFAPKEVSMAIIQSHMKKASETGINLFVLDGKSASKLYNVLSLIVFRISKTFGAAALFRERYYSTKDGDSAAVL